MLRKRVKGKENFKITIAPLMIFVAIISG